MAKYFGNIGYKITAEVEPGTWEPTIINRPYYGDINRSYIRESYAADMTTNILSPVVNNTLSIVADPYAYEHFHNIVCAEFMGAYWTVDSVEVEYPRLILSLGEIYNGN